MEKTLSSIAALSAQLGKPYAAIERAANDQQPALMLNGVRYFGPDAVRRIEQRMGQVTRNGRHDVNA